MTGWHHAQLQKAMAERMLKAERTHHLGYPEGRLTSTPTEASSYEKHDCCDCKSKYG